MAPGPSGPGAPRYDYPRSRGFFSRLFDFSFEEFITPSIIKILFIISMVVIGLGVLGGIIFGFMASAGTGVMFLSIWWLDDGDSSMLLDAGCSSADLLLLRIQQQPGRTPRAAHP